MAHLSQSEDWKPGPASAKQAFKHFMVGGLISHLPGEEGWLDCHSAVDSSKSIVCKIFHDVPLSKTKQRIAERD